VHELDMYKQLCFHNVYFSKTRRTIFSPLRANQPHWLATRIPRRKRRWCAWFWRSRHYGNIVVCTYPVHARFLHPHRLGLASLSAFPYVFGHRHLILTEDSAYSTFFFSICWLVQYTNFRRDADPSRDDRPSRRLR
jgi:hypothetical protein